MPDPVCLCDLTGEPRCGFCSDDLYCPQCGQEITRVFALSGSEDSKEIWIYASETLDGRAEFRFSLSSVARGRNRSEIKRAPQLDLLRSHLDPTDWFERSIREFGANEQLAAMEYCLIPRQESLAIGSDWHEFLPVEGVAAALQAAGGFRETSFALRICRAPVFDFSFAARSGVLEANDVEQSKWLLWKRGKLQAWLTIKAKSSPVRLLEPLGLDADAEESWRFELEQSLPAGTVLKPGEPQTVLVTIDTSNWADGTEKGFELMMLIGTDQRVRKPFQFEMYAMPNLAFSVGSRLIEENARLGDRYGIPLTVNNEDREKQIYLKELKVEFGSPGPKDWLRATWRPLLDQAAESDRESLITLEPGEQRALDVELDLSGLSQVPADGTLAATIVVSDEFRTFELPVNINGVQARPQLDGWLAIDFGSTNTYAAIHDKTTRQARGVLRYLTTEMDGIEAASNGERFDSILYFDDAVTPRYRTGPEALVGELSTALVSGMKRWIGMSAQQTWVVFDGQHPKVNYDAETLAFLYLRDVIRRSEDSLRAQITKIGLSFPTNFGDARIAAMERVCARLTTDFASQSPPRNLIIDRLRLDEATAVALAFVLDIENLRKIVAPIVAERNSLVVASFDFGGGTIDTALLRFKFNFARNIINASIESHYLGIGGDENFGGENVTLALLELLYDRLIKTIRDSSQMPRAILELARRGVDRASDPRQGSPNSAVARTNFEAFWAMAERIKVTQCQAAAQNGQLASEALTSFLRVQLNLLRARLEPHLPEVLLVEHSDIFAALEKAIADGDLLVPLEEVYEHQIRQDFRSRSPGSIRQRLAFCLDELAAFAKEAAVKIDVLVIAGAAARLPLVRELVDGHAAFREARQVFDMANPKCQVASGLVRYLALREQFPDRVKAIASPLDYTHHAIGHYNAAFHDFSPIVPAWTAINDNTVWFEFGEAHIQELWNSQQQIQLYSWQNNRETLLGHFDLRQPGRTSDESAPYCTLPIDNLLKHECQLSLRFADRFVKIELRISSSAGLVGYWILQPASRAEDVQ